MMQCGMPDQMTEADLTREWVKSQQNILAYIGSLTCDFREAEELLQETAVLLFQHADRYDAGRPFLPWALGIARNVVLHHRRHIARHYCMVDSEVMEQLAAVFDDLAVRRDRLRESLRYCREKLPSRSQHVCRLRYEGGLNIREIALRLDSTAGAVRIQLHRIRDQLRRCINGRLGVEGTTHE